MPLSQQLLIFVSAFAPGDDGAIHAYHFEMDTAQWTLAERTADVEYPFFMALSLDKQFLYSIHAAGGFGEEKHEQIAAYKIANDEGRLTLLNHQSALGSAACYLDVDATGKVIVVANYVTGNVAALPINPDGSLGKATSSHQHAGSSVNTSRQEGPHAHCIVVSPNNRFVYAADLGLDQILAYQLDVSSAQLRISHQPFVRTVPGAGPRHLTFHPNGQHVYIINELTNSIAMYDHDLKSGMLVEQQTISTLPDGFDGTSYCADLKITPNGHFLFGTNRGHDSLAVFRIAENGRLTLLEIEPSLGKGPQNLAITPDGTRLVCANMPGNNVVAFQIDQDTGGLTPVGEALSIPSPSCIMIH